VLADLIGLSPVTLLFGVFVLVPIVAAIALSFFTWNGLGNPKFAGLVNWRQVWHDPVAHQSLQVTAVVVVASWVIQTPLSLALGIFVAGKQRWRSVYATIYVLPLLVSTAGLALMWSALLDPTLGGLAFLAHAWHLPWLAQNYLGGVHSALWVVIGITAWQFIPFHTLIYQMGRRQIPEVLYEAAIIDGANPWQCFWRITVPQLRYTIVTSTTLIMVGSLTYFDVFYILTQGGPGNSTRVLALDMYQAAFQSQTYGYASVLAVILGFIGIAAALLIVRLTGFSTMRSQQEGIG
jgi:raffinose/stachyose/melibiose transport system permease protein